MRKTASATFVLALAAAVVSCGGSVATKKAPRGGFSFPQPPAMISSQGERNIYVAVHYWDGFDFADTAFIRSPEFLQTILPNFAGFVSAIPQNKADEAIKGVFAAIDKQDTTAWNTITGALDYYFYDPNSPMRNDEIYITVLRSMLASPNMPADERLRYEDRLAMAQRNRIGQPATDFVYTTWSGRQGRLYDIRSQWTVLFFNNPGCHACAQIMSDLMQSPDIVRRLADGSLKVLSVYPDEDLKAWKEYYPHYPRQWINAWDKAQALRSKELYDLKAIPSLYLLDKDKKVVVKDASEVAPIVQALSR